MTYKGMHNYIHHVNTWWWGKTITLVSKDGYSTVELQFDDNYPTIAFIKGLSVFQTRRKEGYGTEIMSCCEAVAKKEGYTFLQLSVNKEQDWLVEWYKHFGFVIIMKDEHEFTMLKTIKQMTTWKPSEEQIKKELDKAANEWEREASFSPIAMVMDGDRPIGTKQHITSHADSFKAGVDWLIKKLKG